MSDDEKVKDTMKCVLASAHGDDIDSLITMSTDWPKPKRKAGQLLVRVQACSLAPGDPRVLSGQCDYFQSPGSFPYIPGGDICGTVEEADEKSKFKVGDSVVVMFELPRPLGGLAEFKVVEESLAEIKPATINAVEACCLPSSAVCAMLAAKWYVKRGDRVLVLGGSGGVGTFFVQLAKNAGAEFIAVTSTDEPLLKSLGVDRIINYREENWWTVPEFLDKPFDLIFDLAGGRDPWEKAKSTKALKNGWKGGCFIVMNGDEPLMEIHSLWQALLFVMRLHGRNLWTLLWPFIPRYKWHQGLWIKPGTLAELFGMVDEGKLKVVLTSSSPYPFTLKGVRDAFHLMKNRHAHGKVVIQISDEKS